VFFKETQTKKRSEHQHQRYLMVHASKDFLTKGDRSNQSNLRQDKVLLLIFVDIQTVT
jgi:hypothetical protein